MGQNVRSLRCGAALLIIAQALSAGAAQAQIADTVLFDGKVLTGDTDFSALRMGIVVAAGTDAHRVSSYNPFVSLQWYLDGTTIGGTETRGSEEAPSRRQALEMYTRNSAFAANDDERRGTLEPGKLPDLAVLSADYMTVPVKDVGRIRSVLTMVGGKIVFADEPYAGFDVP